MHLAEHFIDENLALLHHHPLYREAASLSPRDCGLERDSQVPKKYRAPYTEAAFCETGKIPTACRLECQIVENRSQVIDRSLSQGRRKLETVSRSIDLHLIWAQCSCLLLSSAAYTHIQISRVEAK